MKTSIFAFVFIAAVAVFVFPPVVGPDDTDSPEIIIRSSDETGSDNPRWIASGVLYNTDDESDEISGSWPVPRPDDGMDVSVWIGMTDGVGMPNNHDAVIVADGWSGRVWCRTYIFCEA